MINGLLNEAPSFRCMGLVPLVAQVNPLHDVLLHKIPSTCVLFPVNKTLQSLNAFLGEPCRRRMRLLPRGVLGVGSGCVGGSEGHSPQLLKTQLDGRQLKLVQTQLTPVVQEQMETD